MASHEAPQPERGIDLTQTLCDLDPSDDAARAQAVRSACPCRIGWDGFQKNMEVVAQMKKDASPAVRRAALHVFEDAFEMAGEGLPTHPREARDEMLARKRRERWRTPDEEETAGRRWDKKPSPREQVGRRRAGRRD
jgi:hypothetical protein